MDNTSMEIIDNLKIVDDVITPTKRTGGDNGGILQKLVRRKTRRKMELQQRRGSAPTG